MNTFGEKVIARAVRGVAQRRGLGHEGSGGDVEQCLRIAGRDGGCGHVREATRRRCRIDRTQNGNGRVRMLVAPFTGAAGTPASRECRVGHLATVGDEPLPVDRRELVEVATPVVEAVHGDEQVVGACTRLGLAQDVDLGGAR